MKTVNIVGLSIMFIFGVSDCFAAEPYHFLKEITFGSEAGLGGLAMDEVAHRLYVPLKTKVAIVDVTQDQVVGEITNLPGISHVTIDSQHSYGFFCNANEDKASVINLKGLFVFANAKTKENPVATVFDPVQDFLYSINNGDSSVGMFEADDGDAMGTIALTGQPVGAVADAKAGRIYCNLQAKGEIAVIETTTRTVVNHWPIAPGVKVSGMAIDVVNHRLFLGCANKLMVMLDSNTGKVISTVPLSKDVDACAFDPDTQLVFAACKSGVVTIIHEDSPEKLSVTQTVKTQRNSSTIVLDPATHRFYLVVNPETPAKRVVAGSAKTSLESFKVMVYGTDALTH